MKEAENAQIPFPKGMDATVALAVQIAVLQTAFRALLTTHPQKEQVRLVFDQLAGQLLTWPHFLDDPFSAQLLRSMTEALFRPESHLEL